MSGPPIDPERLAALLDGRVDERERAELLARLADSEDAYQAYLDAVAVTRELESERAPTPPAATVTLLRRGWRRWPRGPLVILAAAVLAGVVIWPWLGRSDRATRVAADPLAAVTAIERAASGLPANWDGAPWPVTRGGADEALASRSRAVRAGARIVDLDVALRAGDSTGARTIASDVASLLSGVPGGNAVGEPFRALAEGRWADVPGGDAGLRDASRAAARVLGADDVRVGAWLEAARLAAAAHDAAFFARGGTRDFLQELGRPASSVAASVPAAIADDVRGAALRTPPNWRVLEARTTEALRAAAR